MTDKRKVYTAEVKLRAVEMITEQKLSAAEVARRLGVSENRLHDWKKAVAKKGVEAFPVGASDPGRGRTPATPRRCQAARSGTLILITR